MTKYIFICVSSQKTEINSTADLPSKLNGNNILIDYNQLKAWCTGEYTKLYHVDSLYISCFNWEKGKLKLFRFYSNTLIEALLFVVSVINNDFNGLCKLNQWSIYLLIIIY